MAEASFAQTFLSSLEGRPIKLSADHVENPKNYPARPPYILPRMATPMSKPSSQRSAPGQERSVKVILKSLRNPPLDIKLSSQPRTTSLLDIKTQVTAQTRIPTEKIRILYNKKPVPDSKVLKEVIGEEESAVEFAVMVIGGAAAIPAAEADVPAAPTVDVAGAEALETAAFWDDLRGFLMQRLKDESEAEKLSALFKSSWESSRSKP
ncbi:uncharacterized protein J7T54_003760 [Emericellopsis cladophorae]|uniref:Ubiquitin-like domain-containing protein n=1 Tax=Emericellopsis cladophorae TaxID=2686198 RepID=A0A9P9XY74_9HYPO|nr:uncharacterized protein J7T54_003760 [Emericellopsis cladophorae]KAI6779836.1 hypothetical protein J7T54_003760 [Emericellopsis cladophorae]